MVVSLELQASGRAFSWWLRGQDWVEREFGYPSDFDDGERVS
jgi:hypothetical protein